MKRIIIANWKMNPQSAKEARRLFEKIKTRARSMKRTEAVVAPPCIFLPVLRGAGSLKLGAQDISSKEMGAFTGEVSARMVKNSGASYVIVGHSERRELGEENDIVREKIYQALSHGMRAVLCVGEKERNREAFPHIVKEEIKSALKGVPRRFAGRTIIAYEPVWAISTHSGGKSDTPQNFFEMSIYIRRTILDVWGKSAALKIPIIYGGSVNAKNAKGFLNIKSCAGLLVGRASLDPKEFKKILEIASS